jgi:DNA-binding transcriptional regulator YdaS (Cro superfamily)
MKSQGLKTAIDAAGGLRAIARELGMSHQALSEWGRVPADRILQVEAVTKIPREKLRPDLYRLSYEFVSIFGADRGDKPSKARCKAKEKSNGYEQIRKFELHQG